MNSTSKSLLGAATALLVFAGGAAVGHVYSAPGVSGAGDNTSLTVFPVVMAGAPATNVAEVVGLVLEKEGMRELALAERAFRPAPDAGFRDQTARFGAFVADNPIRTDLALFSEVVGSREVGVQEVRVIVVDRTGALVWADRQKAGDPAFDRARPRNPMTCAVLIAKLFDQRFGIVKAAGASDDGPLAKRFAQRNGLPTPAERAAMEARRDTMKKAGSSAAVTILPVRIAGKADEIAGAHLVETLNGANLCRAAIAGEAPQFELAPTSNEQKRLWDLARAFRDYVRKNPPKTDYALAAEYVMTPSNKVWAVHFVVCDREGEWVLVDFQNEHHGDFKRIAPKTAADCDRLVAKRLTRR